MTNVSRLLEESVLLSEIKTQAIRGDFRKKWQRLAKEQLILIYKDLRLIYIQIFSNMDEKRFPCNYYMEKKEIIKKIEEICEEIDKTERFI